MVVFDTGPYIGDILAGHVDQLRSWHAFFPEAEIVFVTPLARHFQNQAIVPWMRFEELKTQAVDQTLTSWVVGIEGPGMSSVDPNQSAFARNLLGEFQSHLGPDTVGVFNGSLQTFLQSKGVFDWDNRYLRVNYHVLDQKVADLLASQASERHQALVIVNGKHPFRIVTPQSTTYKDVITDDHDLQLIPRPVGLNAYEQAPLKTLPKP